MRKLAIFTAAFACAAAVYVYLLQDVRVLWIAGACLLLSVGGRVLKLRRVSVAALGIVVGFLWCWGYQQVWLGSAKSLVGTKQTLEVRVESAPRSTKTGMAVQVQLELDGRPISCMLYADDSLQNVQPGDRLNCEADVEESTLSIRTGETLYHRSNGNVLLLFAREARVLERGTPDWAIRIRQWLQGRIDVLYSGSANGLLRALMTGDRSGLSFAVQNELAVAGLSHVVAVSGMHVSMLLTMVAFFTGGNPRLTAFFGIPMIVLFAMMTGASPSVCRAAVMQILLLCAPLVHREYDRITTLAAACLILLLENPWAIASVSFQLSFAAVLGLFVLFEPIVNGVMRLKKNPGRVLHFLTAQIASTMSATIFTLPLAVLYFGMISVAALVTNLLVLWAVNAVFTLGALSCILGSLGFVPAWVVTVLSEYILGVCSWIARWPFSAAYPENLPLMIWAVCAYAAVLLLLLSRRRWLSRWLPAVLTAAFVLCILNGHWQFRKDPWRLTALDVGQGQCLVLQIGTYTAVVDCGGSYLHEAGETAARLLHSAGITRIDALILTHYDEDHVNGAAQLLERIAVDSLFLPAAEDESGVRAALELSGRQVFLVESLTEITVPDGKIRLYPPILQENDNNGGVCVLATAGEYDMLITGDMDQFGEMRLLSRRKLPDVELLVAGHHGAADSTSQVLLDAVRPETVVISVGAENAYGHPAEETIARIEAAGAEILRTDQSGTIVQSGR